MKFTKHQKQIINEILNGKVYDIYSYLMYFQRMKYAQYDRNAILYSYETTDFPKTLYYNCNNIPTSTTVLSPSQYKTQSQLGKISPEKYESMTITLNYSSGIKRINWENTEYKFDFYNGIYIANSFDDILEFLVIWEYLKSEMLILELPIDITPQVIGVFFEQKEEPISQHPSSEKEYIKQINFDTRTYDDSIFCNGIFYNFSEEHCKSCNQYIDKKIVPVPELNVFIEKNFRTKEDIVQNSSLCAAWLAIVVSILLSIIPLFQKSDTEILVNIQEELTIITKQIESLQIETQVMTKDISQELKQIQTTLNDINHSSQSNEISKQLEMIIEKLEDNQTAEN